MSDVNSCITIGGVLTAAALFPLLDAIEEDGAGLDWGGPPESWTEHLSEIVCEGKPLLLTRQTGAFFFEAVEAVCMKHGMPFHAADDGDASENSGGNRIWWPGMDSATDAAGAIEEGPALLVADIRARLGRGQTFQDILREMMEPWRDIPALTLDDGVDPSAERAEEE